jgi:hypothetical protein
MLSKAERCLIIRELGRLHTDYTNCSDDQVRISINQDIFLLMNALSLTAI